MPRCSINAYYGWRPDTPDVRDRLLRVSVSPREIQKSVDLRSGFPACYDQGALGSCTANAIAAALEFAQRKQSEMRAATPSRLFIYYNERVMEGTISEDAGAEIRDGIKSVNQFGAPPETAWKYNIAKFAKKPTKRAYTQAMSRQSLLYQRLDNTHLDDLRACLSAGFPFVFGFSVYEYFESKEMEADGILKMPQKHEELMGGHAVIAVGYDDAKQAFLVRNSWGADWCAVLAGHFWMPYNYITKTSLADDFWSVSKVE